MDRSRRRVRGMDRKACGTVQTISVGWCAGLCVHPTQMRELESDASAASAREQEGFVEGEKRPQGTSSSIHPMIRSGDIRTRRGQSFTRRIDQKCFTCSLALSLSLGASSLYIHLYLFIVTLVLGLGNVSFGMYNHQFGKFRRVFVRKVQRRRACGS